jgi:hypothetical protein
MGNFSVDFREVFLALFGKPFIRFNNQCSHFAMAALPIGSFGVACDLPQAGVTGDGRNLVRAASGLGQTPPAALRRLESRFDSGGYG